MRIAVIRITYYCGRNHTVARVRTKPTRDGRLRLWLRLQLRLRKRHTFPIPSSICAVYWRSHPHFSSLPVRLTHVPRHYFVARDTVHSTVRCVEIFPFRSVSFVHPRV